ncbi:hypothetical protein [Micromonospora sp. WMMD980]|uniref:hypothetical protein n=1 Tax=Micromonospora sp. WMMD980 TaxID=3016088 RepID=UPI00241677FE|nr:hypothetical protein [Micromonospora sp. WMMD980]MDG4799059.1 hypothetical protein [Micromonospora sp. WMMD980]
MAWEVLEENRWRWPGSVEGGDVGVHVMRLADGVFAEYHWFGAIVFYRQVEDEFDPQWPLTNAPYMHMIDATPCPPLETEDAAWALIDQALAELEGDAGGDDGP